MIKSLILQKIMISYYIPVFVMLAEMVKVRDGGGTTGFIPSLDSVEDKLSQDEARSSIDCEI